MDNTISRNLKDRTGRIIGYTKLISKQTDNQEILELTSQVISEAETLLEIFDMVEFEVKE